jgi:molecular chaperone DnaK (HSP70)
LKADPEGNNRWIVEEFGADARRQYAALVDDEKLDSFAYFRQFKMALDANDFRYNRSLKIRTSDAFAREFSLEDVFCYAFMYMRDRALEDIAATLGSKMRDQAFFVVTIPAIWSGEAREAMKAAGRKAGINLGDSDVMLALEPEAAVHACRLSHQFEPLERGYGELLFSLVRQLTEHHC